MTRMLQNFERMTWDAQQEILRLRRINEVLQAKVDTMDLLAEMFRITSAKPQQPATIDIVSTLDDALRMFAEDRNANAHVR